MDIEARKNFIAGPHRSKFHEAITSDWLQAAVNAALLDVINGLPSANDQFTAMANSLRIDGARKFVQIFSNLTEQTQPRKMEVKANLKHNA